MTPMVTCRTCLHTDTRPEWRWGCCRHPRKTGERWGYDQDLPRRCRLFTPRWQTRLKARIDSLEERQQPRGGPGVS